MAWASLVRRTLIVGVALFGIASGGFAQVGKGLLDLNTASEQELSALPNMTPAIAKEVVAKRPFASITAANRAHSQSADTALQDLLELRRVTERNAGGVRQTRESTANLLRYADELSAVVTDLSKQTH